LVYQLIRAASPSGRLGGSAPQVQISARHKRA
jgi:hypothetical protein